MKFAIPLFCVGGFLLLSTPFGYCSETSIQNPIPATSREIRSAARGLYKIGERFLQGLINIMVAASPGKTRVYLPAPASDPNTGVTMGLMPVFVKVDSHEEIRHIFAPSLTYNNTFGVNMVLRYYWYPTPSSSMVVFAAYAQHTNRRVTWRFEDKHFLKDWFYIKWELHHQTDGGYRFFGIGPRSPFDKQANYTLYNNYLIVHTGINFLKWFRFTLTHRLRRVNIGNGPITSLPQITDFNPRPEGVESEKDMVSQRISLSYDSRDMILAPTVGQYWNLFTEKAGHMGGDSSYMRSGVEYREFYPMNHARYVTGVRFLMEGQEGSSTFFYDMSLLGGKDSLRGFGEARFMDRYKLSYSLEERIQLYTLKAFNVAVNFELTPFYEAGMVYHDLDNSRASDLHHVYGLGFRTVVRPNVVGVVDLGFSEEGTALFVGIDYPF